MRQPDRWSCTPAAFSFVTGIPYDKLIREIGHDGSAILWPQYPEPYNRRGFIAQECIVAILKFGFATISIDPLPAIILPNDELYGIVEENDHYIKNLLFGNKGVLNTVQEAGHRHSFAWNGLHAYCPTNGEYIDIDEADFRLDKFLMIKEIK